jgi:hypothetical protein
VPGGRSIRNAWVAVAMVPTASMLRCTPPWLSSVAAVTGSVVFGSMTSVAPRVAARARRWGCGSMAMIWAAPAMRAARPTPPQPITAMMVPGSARAMLKTAAVPVVTQHDSRAPASKDSSAGRGMVAAELGIVVPARAGVFRGAGMAGRG